MVILLFLASCGNSNSSSSGKLIAPNGEKIYFGAFPDFGGSENVVSVDRVKSFESIVGKKIAWAMFSNNWYNGISFPKSRVDAIYSSGAVPYIRLMPRSDDTQGDSDKKFSLQNIIDGKFDDNLKNWAKEAKNYKKSLLLDFGVEPNGDWFPWSGKFNGGSKTDGYGNPNYPDGPERYKDAYIHIIDIFREIGANNVTWFFHYNYVSFPNSGWNQPKYYYPGDDYIDWIGFSLYGAQTLEEEWEGLEFSTQLKENIGSFRAIGANKPVALLEFGVTDNHPQGSKAVWLKDAFDTILSNQYIKLSAISIWHENWENENETLTTLRLDSSKEAQDTFRESIGNSRFISDLKF